ncbi:hypothetical protein JDV02_007472 [Purpureocillium takamizusanense]|uniref:Uncharacterized protein n=1 Tax=Purpureocillium takamizusanense TaxID=2060973 RepID=A0A9Q8VCC4_9HYPO|nr:uncharacterized protein JDV02_007472 [Purpureocillium takamizusanense]UNI21485.1 hypothetical protein JDV02_007472 [Purpureocillium takamizusanense]
MRQGLTTGVTQGSGTSPLEVALAGPSIQELRAITAALGAARDGRSGTMCLWTPKAKQRTAAVDEAADQAYPRTWVRPQVSSVVEAA